LSARIEGLCQHHQSYLIIFAFAISQAREKAQVSGIVVTSGDTVAYLADQHGFIYVYDIQEYGLWGAELQPPNSTQ